jgi:hypothetical protein
VNEAGHGAQGTSLAGAGDVLRGTGMLRGARKQSAVHHGRRRRRRALVLVSAIAAVAAAGVTVTLLAGSGGGEPSPLAAVTSAIARTSAQDYSFSLNLTTQLAGKQIDSTAVSGALDPGRGLGAELLTSSSVGRRSAEAQIRFIGKFTYIWVSSGSGFQSIGKPWNKAPIPPGLTGEAKATAGAYGFVSDLPVSPSELSGSLLSAGNLRDAGPSAGKGWTGTKYTFTAAISGGSLSGTVYVDQQGRARRIVTITSQGKFTKNRDLTFDNFGTQKAVTAPPASQVRYTSNPYWGFYF